MKIIVGVLILVLAGTVSHAQVPPTGGAGAPGCGPANEKFDVKTDKGQHLGQLEPEKALIYVVQDDSHFESRPRPATRIGIDGKWIGAMHSNSYLFSSVEPGEHHLCASWQSFVGFDVGLKVAALHFTAEGGKSYYFAVKDKWLRDHGPPEIEFVPLDSDEGQLLAGKFSVAKSRLRK
jgi:hypothetical protein